MGAILFVLWMGSHRNEAQVCSELDWMVYLHHAGVRVAQPVHSVNEQLVETFEDEGKTFRVSVFKKAQGTIFKSFNDVSEQQLRQWGQQIRNMHEHTKSYCPESESITRPDWSQDEYYIRMKTVLSQDPEMAASFAALERCLLEKNQDKQVYGLIHADLHPGNFFIDDQDNITLIDFDDCLYHWFAYDLAVALFSLNNFFPGDENQSCRQWAREVILSGYCGEQFPDERIIEDVDLFIQLRAFLLFVWIKDNLENLATPSKRKENRLKHMALCRQQIQSFNWSACLM
ncbi:MAG: Homoserine kinase [Candidatus Celerinatantimonas neptuna]|nr:MAG: Homoserine kinase [Candidatus Celerinatantimonas neptuna]